MLLNSQRCICFSSKNSIFFIFRALCPRGSFQLSPWWMWSKTFGYDDVFYLDKTFILDKMLFWLVVIICNWCGVLCPLSILLHIPGYLIILLTLDKANFSLYWNRILKNLEFYLLNFQVKTIPELEGEFQMQYFKR